MSQSDDVKTEVLNALYWDLAVPRHRVIVEVENGWVTMSGMVDRPYQRTCAESDARRVPGVTGVTNQIRLAPAASLFVLRDRLVGAENAVVDVMVVDRGDALRPVCERAPPTPTPDPRCRPHRYANGFGGLPQDDREAVRLFKLAADQEDDWAQYSLGLFYAEGLGGLPQDEREAAPLQARLRPGSRAGKGPPLVHRGRLAARGRRTSRTVESARGSNLV